MALKHFVLILETAACCTMRRRNRLDFAAQQSPAGVSNLPKSVTQNSTSKAT